MYVYFESILARLACQSLYIVKYTIPTEKIYRHDQYIKCMSVTQSVKVFYLYLLW